MSSLADSFLDDLDELNESSDEEDDQNHHNGNDENELSDFGSDEEEDNEDKDNAEGESGGDKMNIDDVLVKMIEAKATNTIGLLRHSNRYKRIFNEVLGALALDKSVDEVHIALGIDILGPLEEDPEYKLILSCNKLVQDIDDDISATHRYVGDIYSKKFPELVSLIQNKIDYIKTVSRIGNEMDMTVIEFNDLLPSALVMIVSVTGSTTSGKPLSNDEITECCRACDEIMSLDNDKSVILKFIESRMNRIAPNTCALIGARIAAHVVGLAGGIVALSKIPSCNIQVIGQEKRHLAGFSNVAALPHTGVLYYCDLIQSCPPFLRKKVLKVVSSKVALLARVDSYKTHTDGSEGLKFRKEVEGKVEKFQEPQKARTKKALPIPIEKKKSRRGGKRVRRMKERFKMTDIRSQQNRITFSTDVGEYGDSAMGVDVGMVGHKDTGKVRAVQKKEVKMKGVFNNKRQKGSTNGAGAGAAGSSGATNGLSSSLVFTPVQGLELVNPNAAADRVREANNKWFNNNSGFLSAAPK